jgi:hypothetical protein
MASLKMMLTISDELPHESQGLPNQSALFPALNGHSLKFDPFGFYCGRMAPLI